MKKHLATLVLTLGLFGGSSAVQSAPLTTAAAVRSLSAEDAAKALPVKLRGVVTFYDDGLFSRFLQDETAGIYLEVTNSLTLQPGQIIEVEGVTGPGEFAPVVKPESVTVVGNGSIPAARPSSVKELLSGVQDSQLIEMSGNVRAARFERSTGNYYFDIVSDGERISVVAKQIPVAQPDQLVDSIVRVRGVCSTLFNRQRQLFGVRLLVPNASGLVVEKSASANPFDVTVQPLDSLLRFTPEGMISHRVKVRGTVTYFQPGSVVFIQDAKLGLQCQTTMRDALQPGDTVEILGSPAKGEYTPVFEDAVYRKIAPGAEPKPDLVDLNEILIGVHDCRLVQISAKVLERVDRGVNQFLLLSAGGFVFQAHLPTEAAGSLDAVANGSDVVVTGICLIERGNNWQAGKEWRAKSFRLLLRSGADLKVINSPPQWSNENVLLLIGATEAVLAVVILWLFINRRKNPA